MNDGEEIEEYKELDVSEIKKICLDWQIDYLDSQTYDHFQQPVLPPFTMIKEGTFFMY